MDSLYKAQSNQTKPVTIAIRPNSAHHRAHNCPKSKPILSLLHQILIVFLRNCITGMHIHIVMSTVLFYYRAMLAQSAVMRLLSSVRLSVRPSVTIRYRVQNSNTLEFFDNNFTAK